MGLNEYPPAAVGEDADGSHVDGADWGDGVGEGNFALGELEPEVVDVFGARGGAPRGECIGRKARCKPVGQRLRGSEAERKVLERGGSGHGGFLLQEETARVMMTEEREMDVWDIEREVRGFGREDEEKGKSCDYEVRKR